MIQAHPFLGHGINLYYHKLPSFASVTETYRGYAHNSYLQMWSEVGLLGLLLFLWPFFAVFYLKARNQLLPSGERYFEYALGIGILAFLSRLSLTTISTGSRHPSYFGCFGESTLD